MGFQYIDQENWKRKPYFDHYMNQVRCTYSMTVNIDVTDLRRVSKERELKFYPVSIYLLSTVVNRYQEFRTSMDDQGRVGYWEQLNPSYTIFHQEEECISNLWTDYDASFRQFYRNYLWDEFCYGKKVELSPKGDDQGNTFPISSIPWVSFTGFNLNLYTNGTYLLPIFTMGKFIEAEGKVLLPLSIQVHHGVCDGFHLSRFIQDVQQMAEKLDWLEN